MAMNSENRFMHGIAVAILTEEREQSVVLNTRVETTHMARTVFSHVGFPVAPSDAVLRQVLDQRAEIVLVDIDPQNPQRAIRAIEMIHAAAGDVTIFAIGEMAQPANIVSAMRAGAREFLDRGSNRESMIEAFTRFTASLSRAQRSVDFAPIGHAALQLNLRPQFTVVDALQNLHRMDVSLLEGLMTHYRSGLHLLAGAQQPHNTVPTATELARLFDLLVSQYNFVVVDCSGRMDATMQMICDLSNAVLMVAQTDVVSLWSAGRIQTFLQEGAGRDRLRIVLNRYKKIPGFTEEDVEKATNCKVLWKIPNNFQVIGPAIDKGNPVALHDSEVGRSYQGLAAELAGASSAGNDVLSLVYRHDKGEATKRPANRLVVSPARAGQ